MSDEYKKILYEKQKELPKLPIPPLNDTLEFFEDIAISLCNDR